MKDFDELEEIEKLSKSMSEENVTKKQTGISKFIIMGSILLALIIISVLLINTHKIRQEESKPDIIYEDNASIEEDPLDDLSDNQEEREEADKEPAKRIKTGETVKVDTECGSFEIMAVSAARTTWYDESDDIEAIAVRFEINNINYAGKYDEGYLDGYTLSKNGHLTVSASDGFKADYYDISGPSDGQWAVSKDTFVSEKARVSYPYLVPSGTKEIIVNVNGQYEIPVEIESKDESQTDRMAEDEAINEEVNAANESDSTDTSGVIDGSSDNNESGKSEDVFAVFDELLKKGSDTGELYVTGDIIVGKDKDVKPGIYDMSFLGGTLNGYIGHPDFGLSFYGENNEVARLILFEGTKLECDQVSKVKFTAVKNTKPLSSFGQGQYLVGRDVEEGNYLISTNGSLGDGGWWSIDIYSSDDYGDYSVETTQQFEQGNTDIAISLREGEILSLTCDRWECTGNIILTKMN